jgi:type IV pilus assembly protein PilN
MRNLESAGWMKDPDLSIIEAKHDDKAPASSGDKALPYQFTLQVRLANPNDANDADAAPAKPGAQAPAAQGNANGGAKS